MSVCVLFVVFRRGLTLPCFLAVHKPREQAVDSEAFCYAADCGVELAKKLVHGGKVRVHAVRPRMIAEMLLHTRRRVLAELECLHAGPHRERFLETALRSPHAQRGSRRRASARPEHLSVA